MTQVNWVRIVLMGLLVYAWVTAGVYATEPVKLTMLQEEREAHREWQLLMVAEYQRLNPHVEIELVSHAGMSAREKMQTMLAGGVAPDIGYMDPWVAVDWGRSGILEDLQPYIERERGQFADWYPTSFDLYRVGSSIYALPQDLQIAGIFYNRDHFDAAGLGYPGADWTYDLLMEDARRLAVRGADERVTRYGFRIPTSRNWAPLIWGFGGDLLDSWTEPTQFTGNSPEIHDAFSYLQNLVTLGAVQDRPTHNAIGTIEAFTGQHVSMLLTNTVVLGDFSRIDDFNWDVVPLPRGPAGRVPFINALSWFLFSTSENKETAWDVLRFFTTEEALRLRVQIISAPPPSVRLIQSEWLPSLDAPANRHLLLHDIDRAKSPWPLHGDLWSPINSEGLAVVWGDKPVGSALAEMEARVTTVIRNRAVR